jgi:hypothetical protein
VFQPTRGKHQRSRYWWLAYHHRANITGFSAQNSLPASPPSSQGDVSIITLAGVASPPVCADDNVKGVNGECPRCRATGTIPKAACWKHQRWWSITHGRSRHALYALPFAGLAAFYANTTLPYPITSYSQPSNQS